MTKEVSFEMVTVSKSKMPGFRFLAISVGRWRGLLRVGALTMEGKAWRLAPSALRKCGDALVPI